MASRKASAAAPKRSTPSRRAKRESDDGDSSTGVEIVFQKTGCAGGNYAAIPENLRVHISEKIWSGYSPVRRESFCRMLANPNAFFYRNRPPGDPQLFGPFTDEEEANFLLRLKYFREELGINDGLWGSFSVPILGRVGYQCSNFYRQLIQNGKVRDPGYGIGSDGKLFFKRGQRRSFPPESLKILEKEAIKFVVDLCAGQEQATVTAPIRVDRETGEGVEVMKRSFRRAPGAERGAQEHVVVPGRRKFDYRKYARPKPPERQRRLQIEGDDLDSWSGLRYARDSVTGMPMSRPMLDPLSGFVLDAATWVKLLKGEIAVSFEHYVDSSADLIPMTVGNFEEYKWAVANVGF